MSVARARLTLRQSAKLTTYRAVPLAEVRNRPTKVSAPERRCSRPKGPGSVRVKRRHDRTTSVNHAIEVVKATTRCPKKSQARQGPVAELRAKASCAVPKRMLPSSRRTATIPATSRGHLEVAVLTIPAPSCESNRIGHQERHRDEDDHRGVHEGVGPRAEEACAEHVGKVSPAVEASLKARDVRGAPRGGMCESV